MSFTLEWAAGSFPAVKDADQKMQAKRRELKAIFDEAGPDLDPKKVTSIQVADGAALHEVVAARNTELEQLKADLDKGIATAKAAYSVLHGPDGIGLEPGDGASAAGQSRKAAGSIGDALCASQAFKGYRTGQGVGPVATLDMSLAEVFRPRAADFLTTAGWDPEDTRTGRVELFATRPAPMVVDFLPQTTTGQSTVVYMEETTFTNNAAEAAEAAAYGQATLILTEKTSEVRKIATWLPASDEQFEDEPRARDYVNNRLPFMLRQRLDLQVLVGNGTAPNLRGTENVVGINTQALGTDSIPDAIYKGMRQIRDTGFAEPSVVFIAPSKWETVRLLKTADGQYIWGHPSVPGPETIWGVQVAQTTAVTSTKAVIGDYRNFSELAVRRGIDVQMTNSHDTFFINGKQAIRADMRAALVHYRPTAFTAVTGL